MANSNDPSMDNLRPTEVPKKASSLLVLGKDIAAVAVLIWALATTAFPKIKFEWEKSTNTKAMYFLGDYAVVKTAESANIKFKKLAKQGHIFSIDVNKARLFHQLWKDAKISVKEPDQNTAEFEIKSKISEALTGNVIFLREGYNRMPGREPRVSGEPKFSDRTTTILTEADCLYVHAVKFSGARVTGASFPNNVFVKGAKVPCQ